MRPLIVCKMRPLIVARMYARYPTSAYIKTSLFTKKVYADHFESLFWWQTRSLLLLPTWTALSVASSQTVSNLSASVILPSTFVIHCHAPSITFAFKNFFYPKLFSVAGTECGSCRLQVTHTIRNVSFSSTEINYRICSNYPKVG